MNAETKIDEAGADPAPRSPDGATAPHVTIHCFASTEEDRTTLESFAKDRRLRRASISVDDGGLEAAAEKYDNTPSPHLIIIADNTDDETMPDRLSGLADRCDVGTKVIIIGARNDIGFYRDLMDQGISDYFVSPADPAHLARSVTRLFSGTEVQGLGKLFVFIGAKGGVGNTTVAQNTAWALSERRKAGVLFADMDLAFGTVALGCDVPAAKGIADVVREADRLDDALLDRLMTSKGEHLRLLTAPEKPGDAPEMGEDDVRAFLDVAQKSMPSIALDLPHQWNDWVRTALSEANEVVVTTIPTISGVRNAASLLAAIRDLRPDRGDPILVVNHQGVKRREEISAKEMEESLGLKADCTIPFDAAVFGKAESRGKMISEIGGGRCAKAFVHLANRLTGHPEPKQSSYLSKLFGSRS